MEEDGLHKLTYAYERKYYYGSRHAIGVSCYLDINRVTK